MKYCSHCLAFLSADQYSNRQRRLPHGRCKRCVSEALSIVTPVKYSGEESFNYCQVGDDITRAVDNARAQDTQEDEATASTNNPRDLSAAVAKTGDYHSDSSLEEWSTDSDGLLLLNDERQTGKGAAAMLSSILHKLNDFKYRSFFDDAYINHLVTQYKDVDMIKMRLHADVERMIDDEKAVYV